MDSAVQWLWRLTGRKKGYVLALTLIQGVSGGLGVLYALLLRNIVDSAVGHDSGAFWHNVVLIVALVILQISLSAIVRWINELAKSDIENCFNRPIHIPRKPVTLSTHVVCLKERDKKNRPQCHRGKAGRRRRADQPADGAPQEDGAVHQDHHWAAGALHGVRFRPVVGADGHRDRDGQEADALEADKWDGG